MGQNSSQEKQSDNKPDVEVGMKGLDKNSQNSSQVEEHSENDRQSDMKIEMKDPGSKRKSVKRKRSTEAEQINVSPGSQEQAKAYLQMLNGASEKQASYLDNAAASQQLLEESIEARASTPVKGDRRRGRRSTISKDPDSHRLTAKRRRHGQDVNTFDSSGESESEWQQSPLQSDQSSSTTSEPDISQSQHALDDVSTDEDTAAYENEFGNGTLSEEPPTSHDDIFSFSQQPPEAVNSQTMKSPPYKLPTLRDGSPKISKPSKKRKRPDTHTLANLDEESQLALNGNNQRTIDLYDPYLSKTSKDNNDDDGQIDPVLHSMTAVPPAVDLSALGDESISTKKAKSRKTKTNDLSQATEARVKDDGQPPSDDQDSSHDLIVNHSDQENSQSHVVRSDGLQRRSSPELGIPSMKDDARRNVVRPGAKSKSIKNSGSKTKKDSGNTLAGQKNNDRKENKSRRSVKEVAQKGGPYSSAEIEKIDTFRDSYCKANRMTFERFNHLIQSKLRYDADARILFDDLHETLPYRPPLSLQKFVRRRFHNHVNTGFWTAEEDELLRQAVEEKGKSWKIIGEIIDRGPNACRDRWRDHIYNSENRNREQWTEDEVLDLGKAVRGCLKAMKRERQQVEGEEQESNASEVDEDSEQETKDMDVVNWQAVSDRMGGSRSRKQCYTKWMTIKKQGRNEVLQLIYGKPDVDARKAALAKKNWRYQRSRAKVANMNMVDRYVLLKAILASRASTEGNIPWRSLGEEEFRAKWDGTDRKQAWEFMKHTMPGSASMHYREIANELIRQVKTEGGIEHDDPPVHRQAHASKSKILKARTELRRKKANGVPNSRSIENEMDGEHSSTSNDDSTQESNQEEDADIVTQLQKYAGNVDDRKSEQSSRSSNSSADAGSDAEDEKTEDEAEDAQSTASDSLFDDEASERSGDRSSSQDESRAGKGEPQDSDDDLFVSESNREEATRAHANGEMSSEMVRKIRLLQSY